MTVKNRSRLKSRMLVENLESRVLLSGTYSIASYTGVPGADNGVARPDALVVDGNGNLFGTTQEGGTLNYGTVFEIPAGTNDVLTLASFDNSTGVLPKGNLVVDSSGNLFGTASGGGTNNRGTLWELKKGDSTITNLWNFAGGSGGAYPQTGLVADAAGNLWGTTFGNDVQFATVFEYTPPTISGTGQRVMQNLATFSKDVHLNSSLAVGTDGKLAKVGGFVFGTIYTAKGANDGEIFQLGIRPKVGNVAGNVGALTVLGNFNTNGNNARLPEGSLLYLKSGTGTGALVGITIAGGRNDEGSLFQATLPVGRTPMRISVLASFTNTQTIGRTPLGTLLASPTGSGSYVVTGVTAQGGENGNGGVYRTNLTTNAGGTFTADSVGQLGGVATRLTDTMGRNPSGGLAIGLDGSIYFTTANKGLLENGSVVQLTTTGAGADTLTFSVQPHDAIAGMSFGTVTIRAIGANGQVDTTANGNVTLSAATGPATADANGTLVSTFGTIGANGTVTQHILPVVTMHNGVATFPANLTLTTAGDFTLRAQFARGQGQSQEFMVAPGAVTQLAIMEQPETATINHAAGTIEVAAEDAFGNVVTNASTQITLKSGSATVASAGTNRGIATFNNVVFHTTGSVTLTATAGTISKRFGEAIAVHGLPGGMAIKPVAGRVVAGKSFTLQVNVANAADVPVTLQLVSGPRGAVAGTFTATAVNGVAYFSDLMAFAAGTYRFRATVPALGLAAERLVNVITLGQSNHVTLT
ncbi:MAG: beta strand repeat-containing protein [Phycisphaerae bacterium]